MSTEQWDILIRYILYAYCLIQLSLPSFKINKKVSLKVGCLMIYYSVSELIITLQIEIGALKCEKIFERIDCKMLIH